MSLGDEKFVSIAIEGPDGTQKRAPYATHKSSRINYKPRLVFSSLTRSLGECGAFYRHGTSDFGRPRTQIEFGESDCGFIRKSYSSSRAD